MRYHECPLCGEEVDAADYATHESTGQAITQCLWNHHKIEVSVDFSFDDGSWRDCSTIRPLLALPAHYAPHHGFGNTTNLFD